MDRRVLVEALTKAIGEYACVLAINAAIASPAVGVIDKARDELARAINAFADGLLKERV